MRRKSMKHKSSKKKKRILVCAIAAGLVTAAGVWFFAVRPRRGMVMAKGTPEAMSTEVESGSISTTVVGTGTLQNDTAGAVRIPEGLTMEEVLVESGDAVQEGDVLAKVNAASVLKALSEAQEELEALDGEINEAKDKEESVYVKTYIAGRVKKIYAGAGKSVLSVMEKKGALLVLSIDGRMAVELADVSGVSAGDTVTVTLTDGTEEEGTVESMTDGVCVVTLTDDGPKMGEKVTVTDADGKELGSGKLYVHQPIEITGTSGTVAEVLVEENEEVSASETLLELEDVSDSAEYQQLLAKRSDLTEGLKRLTQLAADPAVRAEYDGIVASVHVTAEDDGIENSAGSGQSAGGSVANAAEEAGKAAVANADMPGSAAKGIFACTDIFVNPEKPVFSYASAASTAETESEKGITSITDMQALFRQLSSGVPAPVTGEIPAAGIEETEQYTGKLAWMPADGEFEEETVYTAVISLTAKEGWQFVIADGAELSYPGAQVVQWELQEQCEQNTLKLTVTFPVTAKKEAESEKQTESGTAEEENRPQTSETQEGQNPGQMGSASGNAGSDREDSSDGQNVNGTGQSGSTGQQGASQGSDGISSGTSQGNDGVPSGTSQGSNGIQSGTSQGSSAGRTGTFGSTAQSGVAAGTASGQSLSGASAGTSSLSASSASSGTDSGETADPGMETAFTISGNEQMLLSVNIDELDILSIQEGQKVTVTLDALEGQEFEGEISDIDHTASNNGGVTKYTAEVTIPKSESMLAGMNASATIVIESKENILTLPAEAVQEHGNRTFVYTEESEDGILSSEVEVETGISDGTRVEITSGLKEGQTVYYQMAVNEESSGEDFGGRMGFDMMKGGERPDGQGGRGSGAPSGGMPGGGFGGGAPGGNGSGSQ